MLFNLFTDFPNNFQAQFYKVKARAYLLLSSLTFYNIDPWSGKLKRLSTIFYVKKIAQKRAQLHKNYQL